MGDVTELKPRGPWIIECPECDCRDFRLYEFNNLPNSIVCTGCGQPMDLAWDYLFEQDE